jgi:HPt (histidine-containing phosphotransfer) domain-containing protein
VSSDVRPPGGVRARTAAATALLPRFFEHRRRDVDAIRAALECGDFETIGRLGHNMSGNGLAYGFPEISLIGEGLEDEAVTGNAMALRALLEALDACLAHVDEAGGYPTFTLGVSLQPKRHARDVMARRGTEPMLAIALP